MPLEKKIFTAGMDSDTEDRLLQPGFDRYRLNVRALSAEGANVGAIEDVKGNTLVTYTLPAGDNKTIGAYEDKTNFKNYYFVYNSAGNHSILEYNQVNNSVATVLQNSVLNFNSAFLITGINVIEGLLYWTDFNEEPRKINIDKAKNNQYPVPFLEDFIYRIKASQPCEPACQYADDSTKNVNLLENLLFQFRTQWVYDDNEKSAWSPISVPPLPKVVCGQNSNPGINNNIVITADTGSGIVTRINIAARLGNTGDFFTIAELDKSLLGIANNTTYNHAFYNDKVYNFVNLRESNNLFNRVPRKSKAQEIIAGNRIVDGNLLEGFNPVTPDCELSLSYVTDPNTNTYSIEGRIYIKNGFATLFNYGNNQPIHDLQDGNGTVFGGFSFSAVQSTVGTQYFQTLPLNGFVVYLAGTPYYAVSKQVAAANGGTQDGNNVYNSTSSGNKRAKIRDEINGSNCYSTFKINNVPPGKYVMRVADHNTLQADLDNPARPYQNTSTYTVQVGGTQGTETSVTITNANVSVGQTHVFDLTDASLLLNSTAISGYLTDADITPTPTTASGLLSDTRIERAELQMNTILTSFYNGQITGHILTNYWFSGKLYTDHNGFFFFAVTNLTSGSVNVNSMRSGAITQSNISKYKSDGTAFSGVNGAKMQATIMRNNTTGYFDNARTIINGTVQTSASIGIKGISVVIGHGKIEETDTFGNFNVIVYADSQTFPPFVSLRQETIYFAVSDNCIATFTPVSDFFYFMMGGAAVAQTVFVSPYGGIYNYTINVTIANVIANVLSGSGSDVALKRGSIYQLGIIYQDHGGRLGTTNTNDLVYTQAKGLKLIIPFYTEVNGLTNAIFGQSRPVVSWQVKHQAPDWATHWQWVMTKNSATNFYLQWTAKTVTYTDDDRNPVGNFTQGTKIGLGISSIADYNTRFTDSKVSYSYTEGDRVRFIKYANGTFFNEYIDLKIRDYDPSGIIYVENLATLPQIPPGSLFEIYTPKLKSDNEVYWEFGECYEVGNPGTAQRYHKGQSQNQSPTNLSGVPATGTFSSGDTYYRLRSIPYASGTKTWYIEDASFSDFFESKVSHIGRPNKFDPYAAEIIRPTQIYYSEAFIPETKINGLSTVYDDNWETYERSFKSIQKFFRDGQRLTVYQELKVGQVLVDQIIYNDLQGNATVGASEGVLSKQMIYYQGNYGIGLHPESHQNYAGRDYFVDPNNAVVCRLSNDGITEISQYNMKNYFSDKIKALRGTGKNGAIYGTYDEKFGEYVISFEPVYNDAVRPPVLLMPGATLAFNEKFNLWSTFYSYEPDFMCTAGTGIITFKNGALYLHNSNALYNNFYGVQYNSELWIVSNGEPSKKKIFNALSQECDQVWEAYSITTPAGQETNLVAADFQALQGFQYAPLWFDINTPNKTNPQFEGDPLLDTNALFKLRFTGTGFVKLFAINVMWEFSERTNK